MLNISAIFAAQIDVQMRLKKIILLTLLFGIFVHSYGQKTGSKIDKEDLSAFIKTLSSIQFEGRALDNNGHIKTQEFIVKRYMELQLEPFSSDGYLEKFYLNQTSRGDLYLITPNNRTLSNNDSVMINREMKQISETENEIVFGGYGSEDEDRKVEVANVVGLIKGESEKLIVISAHYDHVGWLDKEDTTNYYPGADDNASGVAALLELAEEFSQYKNLKYSMMFLATTGEEGGLLGSSYHVNHPDFDPERVVCNFNLDMISRCDAQQDDCFYLYCISDERSQWLDSLVREADKIFPHCSFIYSSNDTDIFSRTDTYNFSKKGIPSILFFAGFHDDYHQITDTMEKIDFDILANRVKLIGEVLKMLQNDQ